jgi:hypothetical protein
MHLVNGGSKILTPDRLVRMLSHYFIGFRGRLRTGSADSFACAVRLSALFGRGQNLSTVVGALSTRP